MAKLVFPISYLRSGPHHNQRFRDCTGGCKLRDEKDTRTQLALLQMISKMLDHGSPVVRNQYSSFTRGEIEDMRIGSPDQFAVRC